MLIGARVTLAVASLSQAILRHTVSPRSSGVPGMTLSRKRAIKPPTAMPVLNSTEMIWSISLTPSMEKNVVYVDK